MHILLFLSCIAFLSLGASERNEDVGDEVDVIFGQSTKLGAEEKISVDFPNHELITILRAVADLYELNLVVPQELSDSMIRTKIKLLDATWKEIFDVILEPHGYLCIKEGNIVRIYKDNDLKDLAITTAYIVFAYALGILTVLVCNRVFRKRSNQPE